MAEVVPNLRGESWASRLFSRRAGALWPRWLWLRALGLIFFSAFYSLYFQIRGLIGPDGILPAREYLGALRTEVPALARFWAAPSLLWLGSGRSAVLALAIAGMVAAALLVANVWPRVTIALCGLLFLSFTATARAFASYQSDGMLLEGAFLSLFLAPPGLRPGLGAAAPPSWASRFMLVWEWFRIYFESGVVKLASGDPEWRGLTALDHYYQNGPLPTWIGWWVAQAPHWVHAATALSVLGIELAFVWLVIVGRRARIVVFLVVTPMQVVIILTANYAFLNYLVLALGVLLLDDAALAKVGLRVREVAIAARARRAIAVEATLLGWAFYATLVFAPLSPLASLPPVFSWPAAALEPFRVANGYGLFATMTEPRYEIEFQGTRDGTTWIAYPFRDKPQKLDEAPGIYAPYQPRFEWNLWFASLGSWRDDRWVVRTEELLLDGDRDVLALFRADPFAGEKPRKVRAVKSEYRFTDRATRRATGRWWTREDVGLYCPALERAPDGSIVVAPDPAPDVDVEELGVTPPTNE